APAQSAALDVGKHALGAGKELRVLAQARGVVGEKGVAQRLELRALAAYGEPGAKQAPCTMRRMRAQHFQCERRQRVIGADAIERGAEIASGIGQRPVEID